MCPTSAKNQSWALAFPAPQVAARVKAAGTSLFDDFRWASRSFEAQVEMQVISKLHTQLWFKFSVKATLTDAALLKFKPGVDEQAPLPCFEDLARREGGGGGGEAVTGSTVFIQLGSSQQDIYWLRLEKHNQGGQVVDLFLSIVTPIGSLKKSFPRLHVGRELVD